MARAGSSRAILRESHAIALNPGAPRTGRARLESKGGYMAHTSNGDAQCFDDICRCNGDPLDEGLTDEELWDEDFDEDGSCPVRGGRVVMPRSAEDAEKGARRSPTRNPTEAG